MNLEIRNWHAIQFTDSLESHINPFLKKITGAVRCTVWCFAQMQPSGFVVHGSKVHGDSIKPESFSNTRKFVVNGVFPFPTYLLADLGFRSRREGGSHFRLPDESFNL